MRTERSGALMFNVYTGELSELTVEGISLVDYLPVFENIQPRYNIDGNYIGFTPGDSDVILMPINPDKIIKKLRKDMKIWVLIGLASGVLLILSALQIYHNIGIGTVSRVLAVMQFALLVTAIVFFMKTKRFLLSIPSASFMRSRNVIT